MKPLTIFILLLACTTYLLAQERPVEGIVFDRDSKQRISRVYIYNLRTHSGSYNSIKGEFSLTARTGDTLVAAAQGYSVDTLTIHNQKAIVFYLKRTSIQLREVVVTDTVKSPQDQLKQIKKDFKDAYRKGHPQNILNSGGSNNLGGAGLGIDALYSLLSKEGKNARYLQEIIERDYRESIINYRYTKSLVSGVTGLTGDDLDDFMQQYRPTYQFILQANDYTLIKFIKESYQRYLRNPGAFRLPPLNPPEK